ncbi:uncharacterized protein ISCGN_004030 [Ixodes scapularis]
MTHVTSGSGRPPDGGTPSNFQPTKMLTFNVTAPVQASTVDVTDAVADVVGLNQVYMVQHLGGNRFQVILYNSVALEQLNAHGDLSICGQQVATEPLMPRVTRVACLHLPGFGHAADTCTARCRRCAGSHATTDCVRKKSFAEAVDARSQRPDQHVQATPSAEMPEVGPKQPDQPEARPNQPDQQAQAMSVSWANQENFPTLEKEPKTLVLPPVQTLAPPLEEMPPAPTHKTSSGDEVNSDTTTPTWTPASPTSSDASNEPLVIDEDNLETEEVRNQGSPPNSDTDSQDPQQSKDPQSNTSSSTQQGTTHTTTKTQRALRARTPKTKSKKQNPLVSPGSD